MNVQCHTPDSNAGRGGQIWDRGNTQLQALGQLGSGRLNGGWGLGEQKGGPPPPRP